jgi:hypothetical protein
MDILNDILGDITNFTLVIFGFSATLFTVIYSFILNKREYLKELSDLIKNGNSDPLVSQRISNTIQYISSMKKLNFQLIIGLCLSLLIFSICILIKYYQFSEKTKEFLIYFILSLTIILFFQIVYLIYGTIKRYLKETKI